MLIRDKTGGPLLQAELEAFGSSSPTLVADNGRKSFEIDTKDAKLYYRLISATKVEVSELQKAGYTLETSPDFEVREDA